MLPPSVQEWYLHGPCFRAGCLSGQAGPYCYRSAVRDLVPQLRYLDDIPAEDTEPRYGIASLEDWHVIKESIKERLSDNLGPSGRENVSGVVVRGLLCE